MRRHGKRSGTQATFSRKAIAEISPIRSSGSDTTETAERVRRGLDADAAKLDNKKVPPMFIAPPPPADLPPPIDECETPVGPLADEDLFGRSPASREY